MSDAQTVVAGNQVFDAGLWASPSPTAAGGGDWVTLPLSAPPSAAGWPPAVLQFRTLPLGEFDGWLQAEAARPAGDAAVVFPRLELPVGEPARQFLKALRADRIAAWLDRVEAAAAATGRTPARGLLLVAAADYTRAALDLRHLVAAHCPRKGRDAGRRRLVLVLDDFGVDAQGNWQAGPRLGLHYPVYVLARGIPGRPVALPAAAAPAESPDPAPEGARPAVLNPTQAEDIYHGVVGELGTERILFGSGAVAGDARAAEVAAAAAAWFAQPRPWLDAPSLALLFGGNAQRLLSNDPRSLDPEPSAAALEPLETVVAAGAAEPGDPAAVANDDDEFDTGSEVDCRAADRPGAEGSP